jgi:hypothetical protein
MNITGTAYGSEKKAIEEGLDGLAVSDEGGDTSSIPGRETRSCRPVRRSWCFHT